TMRTDPHSGTQCDGLKQQALAESWIPATCDVRLHMLLLTSLEAMENFNEHFKGIFDRHGQVPGKGLLATQRFALGAIFVYQLALFYRFEHDLELCVGLKAFLKAA